MSRIVWSKIKTWWSTKFAPSGTAEWTEAPAAPPLEVKPEPKTWQSEPRAICGTCGEYVANPNYPLVGDCKDPHACRETANDIQEAYGRKLYDGPLIVMHEPATSMVYGSDVDAQRKWHQQEIDDKRMRGYETLIAGLRAEVWFWRLATGAAAIAGLLSFIGRYVR